MAGFNDILNIDYEEDHMMMKDKLKVGKLYSIHLKEDWSIWLKNLMEDVMITQFLQLLDIFYFIGNVNK